MYNFFNILFAVSILLNVTVIGYESIVNENLKYMNNTINELITNKNKNQFLTINIETFKIYNLPKNPKNGGSPPNDNKTKILINLL